MDEEVFERWKKSKARRRRGGIGPIGAIFLGFAMLIPVGASFGVMFAKAPEKLVATVQGHVVKSEHDGDDEHIDEDARDWLRRHVTVQLDSGEKTGVDLPRDTEIRIDALVKLEVYRKALGPLSMEFHKFAGYVDAVK